MVGAQSARLQLMKQLEELESQKEVLNKKEHDILNVLNEINKPKEDRPTKEDLVVAFVKEIEKANQNFEFREYLKRNTERNTEFMKKRGRFAFFEQLVHEKVHHTYDKLDVKDIMDAVQDLQEGNESAVLNPLTKLVQAMKVGHIVEEDPYEELLKIKKDDAFFYQKIFVWKLFQKISANKVIVRYVPEEFTKDEVKQLLSGCGDVVSVDFEYGVEPENKIANVTFGDSVSAKIAPFLMDRTCHTVLPFVEVDLPDVPSSTEYEEALNKYEVFRNRKNISNADTVESPVDMLLGR